MKLYVYDMGWAGAYIVPANSSEEADRFLRQHFTHWKSQNTEIQNEWITSVLSHQKEYDIIPGMVIETEGEG